MRHAALRSRQRSCSLMLKCICTQTPADGCKQQQHKGPEAHCICQPLNATSSSQCGPCFDAAPLAGLRCRLRRDYCLGSSHCGSGQCTANRSCRLLRQALALWEDRSRHCSQPKWHLQRLQCPSALSKCLAGLIVLAFCGSPRKAQKDPALIETTCEDQTCQCKPAAKYPPYCRFLKEGCSQIGAAAAIVQSGRLSA